MLNVKSTLSLKEQRKKQLKLIKEAEEMGTYSGEKLFNKWHNERLMQTVIGKDTFRNVPNERYFEVSRTDWLTLTYTCFIDNHWDREALIRRQAFKMVLIDNWRA